MRQCGRREKGGPTVDVEPWAGLRSPRCARPYVEADREDEGPDDRRGIKRDADAASAEKGERMEEDMVGVRKGTAGWIAGANGCYECG
jgi:hypothetical protein